ncbi:hypothetical protein ACWCWD_29265 [Streptomyces sp. NPDC001493]
MNDERKRAGECPHQGVPHCSNCGSPEPEYKWMGANAGLACSVECYEDMAYTSGAHDKVYH